LSRYAESDTKNPAIGEHSILTVAPHCTRATYTELFDRQKLTVAPTAPGIAPPSASWEPTTARTAIDPARPKIDKRISKVVQAPGFIRGINPKSIFENPQAPAFIRGVNLKSKI
jgi:hypothetical protein